MQPELKIIEPGYDAEGNHLKGAMPPYVPSKKKAKKPKMSDIMTQTQIDALVLTAMQMAGNGDTQMLKFVLEQHFGKAPQSMDITSDGEPIPLLNGLHNNNGGPEAVEAPKEN